MLPGHFPVAVLAAPPVEPAERAAQAFHGGLALHDPVAPPGASPVMREPEEVKRPRPRRGRAPAALRRVWRAGKTNHLRLARMQGETEFGEPLWEDCHEALCITFHRAEDHNIIRKAVQGCFPGEPWFDHLLEPGIEDGVEKDIRQEGRHCSPNAKENFCQVESHV
jgi:hypothetical protein